MLYFVWHYHFMNCIVLVGIMKAWTVKLFFNECYSSEYVDWKKCCIIYYIMMSCLVCFVLLHNSTSCAAGWTQAAVGQLLCSAWFWRTASNELCTGHQLPCSCFLSPIQPKRGKWVNNKLHLGNIHRTYREHLKYFWTVGKCSLNITNIHTWMSLECSLNVRWAFSECSPWCSGGTFREPL